MKNLKGVVLCGGKGTRLGNLTKVTNKHLLPVHDEPMVYHPIKKLVGVGIKEILIVTGKEHMGDFVDLLGSGNDLGCDLTYKVQEEAGGIAQALALAKNFVGDSNCVVLLGDNVFKPPLHAFIDGFNQGARVAIKQVKDPERFGVVEFCENKDMTIKKIIEKPNNPPSKFAVVGIYMYSPEVFNVIPTLKPSNRGELEITDVNNFFCGAGKKDLSHKQLAGYWTDAGTIESLAQASRLVKNDSPEF